MSESTFCTKKKVQILKILDVLFKLCPCMAENLGISEETMSKVAAMKEQLKEDLEQ